jgi:hypothetical protein
MSDRPRAISVRQPWAELIVAGTKSVEIRGWSDRYRGPLWIHAALRLDDHALPSLPRPEELPRGALVGQVELVDIVPFDETRWTRWRDRHLSPGPFPFGAFGFVLARPQRLSRPEPLRGSTKIFLLPDELSISELEHRLEPGILG